MLAILMLGAPVSGSTSVTPTMTSGTAAVTPVPLPFPRLGTGFSLLAGKGAGTSSPPLSGSRSAAGRFEKKNQFSHIKVFSIKSDWMTSVSFHIHILFMPEFSSEEVISACLHFIAQTTKPMLYLEYQEPRWLSG